jgi:hypothetical protein
MNEPDDNILGETESGVPTGASHVPSKQETEIKKLMEAKCCYPVPGEDGTMKECGKQQMMNVSLPVLTYLEGGKIKASDSVSLGVPLCNYHCMLAISSGMFGVKTDDKLGKAQLVAPYEMIHVAESVVKAMVLSGDLPELLKAETKSKDLLGGIDGPKAGNTPQ